MGKCVSKQADHTNWEAQSVDFFAVSERSFVLLIEENEGQSESKKASKRSGPETKGTAMSFGFKKKLYSSGKRNAVGNKEKENEKEKLDKEQNFQNSATVITNPGVIKTDNACGDDNGNMGSNDSLEEKRTGRSTPRLTPPKKESAGAPYRSIRFGFRQGNTVRPASVGLNPKVTHYESISNNNVVEKPRSKSASSTQRSSSAINYNPPQYTRTQGVGPPIGAKKDIPKIAPVSTTVKISYQQAKQKTTPEIQQQQPSAVASDYTNKPPTGRQFTVINTGMHTNEIIRPIPQPPTLVTKFTLHTTSLPKVQYPVPISLTSRYPMDTKIAKQAANKSRQGFQGPRDISTDSGISSIENNYLSYEQAMKSPSRRVKSRPRNLEMIFNGPHKFEVRDLDDSLSDENIIPLSLPKLPSAFNTESSQPAPLSGLIRTEYQPRELESPTEGIHLDFRRTSLTSLDVESIEEEKVFRDNSTTEKEIRSKLLKELSPLSKASSAASSRTSWCNAGESMAMKDCSSLSVSSSESVQKDNKNVLCENMIDEDISLMSLGTDLKSTFSSATLSLPQHPKHREPQPRNNFEEVLTIDIENMKFAQITAAADDTLLDDETSPTVSLVSTDSDEIISKKNKKKINDSIKEKNIDEITPVLEACSPMSPGTPTHASNSLSLSDGGRDFLIDDEIADQPALCFADQLDNTSNIHLHSLTDTPTLIESASHKSPKSKSRRSISQTPVHSNSFAPQAKPRQSLLSRTESLDTLSPCESIASDDLMMDFECHSSLDSIDRMSQSNHSGSGSGLHSIDETQLWSELEAKGGAMLREWTSLLRTSRNNSLSQDKIISQLPAKSTRLLNRSRLNQNLPGSDSPRSLDSFQRKTPSRSSSSQLGGGRDTNSSPDDPFILDKSLRNSMIQDVLCLKKQLIRLRSVLQEPDEECLMRTDTLNPFEISNGQFFGTGGFDSKMYMENKDLYSYSATQEESKQELADLRRQVVFLQSQIDDKDRTIRIQQSLIEKLQLEIEKPNKSESDTSSIHPVDTINTATQTERLRPLSIGQDGLMSGTKSCDTASIKPKSIVTSTLKKPSNTLATNGVHSPAKTTTTTPPISNKMSTRSVKASFTGNCTVTSKQNGIDKSPSMIKNTDSLTNGNSRTTDKLCKVLSPRRIPRLLKSQHIHLVTNSLDSSTSSVNETLNKSNCCINDVDDNDKDNDNDNDNENENVIDNDLYEKAVNLKHLNAIKSTAGSPNNKEFLHNNGASVKLRNNLNLLKSSNFSIPVKSEDDF